MEQIWAAGLVTLDICIRYFTNTLLDICIRYVLHGWIPLWVYGPHNHVPQPCGSYIISLIHKIPSSWLELLIHGCRFFNLNRHNLLTLLNFPRESYAACQSQEEQRAKCNDTHENPYVKAYTTLLLLFIRHFHGTHISENGNKRYEKIAQI